MAAHTTEQDDLPKPQLLDPSGSDIGDDGGRGVEAKGSSQSADDRKFAAEQFMRRMLNKVIVHPEGFSHEVSDSHATHNCWAYKLGEQFHYNNDGEPSSTAGKPIYFHFIWD
ncbi:hypothetical protein ABZP36_028444 [Zizania latifolia]